MGRRRGGGVQGRMVSGQACMHIGSLWFWLMRNRQETVAQVKSSDRDADMLGREGRGGG